MDIADKLNKELLKQDFGTAPSRSDELSQYKEVASCYARMENAIAVLSDMRANVSYIYYGGFAQSLGLNTSGSSSRVHSIWEEDILRLIHPEDLRHKYLWELRFFHFTQQQPKNKRRDYYLMHKLRMRDNTGNYRPVAHRLFYIPVSNSLWLALCLYNPLPFDIPGKAIVIHSTTGQTWELDDRDDAHILSEREKQVLRLINNGMMSKHIAAALSISINTVSRHRQEILRKLQVRNSIEACRVAKELRMI